MPPILGIWASAFAKTAPDTGSYFPLGEFTLASDTANIEFTNIPQTYKHLQIRGIARSTRSAADDTLMVRVGNNTLDTGSNYARHALVGTGSAASSGASTSQTAIDFGDVAAATAASNIFGAFVIDILDYTSVNKNKTFRNLIGVDSNGAGSVRFTSGLWMNSSSAINTIRLYPLSGNFTTNTTIQLFGVLA